MCTKEFFGLKAQNVQFYFLSFHAERSRRMGGAGGTLNGNMEQAKRLKRNFLCNEMNGDDDEKKFSSQFFFCHREYGRICSNSQFSLFCMAEHEALGAL